MLSSFHLVLVSPWPFCFSLVVMGVLVSSLFWFHYSMSVFFLVKLIVLTYVLFLWFGDIEMETWLGHHTVSVYSGMRVGMMLFIVSEVFFFFSFFWSFFHKCWSPIVEVVSWPPYGFLSVVIDPFGLPLLKTVLLLSSGVSITFCHHSMISRYRFGVLFGFLVTLFYGYLFLDVQFEEYRLSKFMVNSVVYGAVFFLLTGFHGFHVMLGMLMISYCFFRFFLNKEFSHSQHVSFEIAAWYWHFVDVVWLFLFVFVYWYSCKG